MCKYLLEQNETQLDKISCTQHYQQEPCTQFTLTLCEHSKYGNKKKLVVIDTQFLPFKKRPNKNGKFVDAKQNKKEKKMNIALNGETIQNWNVAK